MSKDKSVTYELCDECKEKESNVDISSPAEAHRITRERVNRIERARMATPNMILQAWQGSQQEAHERQRQREGNIVARNDEATREGNIVARNDEATREAIQGAMNSAIDNVLFQQVPSTAAKSKADLLEEEVVDLKAQVHEMSKQLDFIKSLVVESDSNASKMAKVVRSLGKYTPIIIDPSDNRGEQ